MQVTFKFGPNQHVKITAGGLNCEGRVLRCIKSDGELLVYGCDYYLNGERKSGEFFEDEIA